MNETIEKVRTHLYENRKKYLIGIGCFVAGVLVGGTVVYFVKDASGNKAMIDSFNLIKYKSPHTSQLIQILSPGNSGNVIKDVETGIIYPSQNAAAKALGINPSNISSQLNGKNADVAGHIFEKIIDGAASHELHVV